MPVLARSASVETCSVRLAAGVKIIKVDPGCTGNKDSFGIWMDSLGFGSKKVWWGWDSLILITS